MTRWTPNNYLIQQWRKMKSSRATYSTRRTTSLLALRSETPQASEIEGLRNPLAKGARVPKGAARRGLHPAPRLARGAPRPRRQAT